MTTALGLELAPGTLVSSPSGPALLRVDLPSKTKAALMAKYPPRLAARTWPEAALDRAEVLELVARPTSGLKRSSFELLYRRGLPRLFDWLEEQPGETFQERWAASGADTAGGDWGAGLAAFLEAQGRLTDSGLSYMMSSVNVLVGSGVLRPSLFWLLTGAKGRRVIYDMVHARDPEGFSRLKAVCEQDPAVTPVAQRHAMYRCAVIVATKGGKLADLTVGDVLELLNAEDRFRADVRSRPALFKVMREMGVFRPDVPAWRALRRYGQLSVEELVDRYPIACRAIRDLLVGYLAERQPSVDYRTVVKHCYELVGCFWVDLEAHHPGIDTLRLTPEVASAWKARLRTIKARHPEALGEGTERYSYLDVLSTVRAFYLDLAEWALEDPARWGPWVAPCPIRKPEMSRRKFVRQRKARIDARTRERLPLLP